MERKASLSLMASGVLNENLLHILTRVFPQFFTLTVKK